jgi:hypothetical protein
MSNMLGLYYLPKAFIPVETGLTFEGACKALQSLIEVGFCDYDDDAQMVWVFDMAETQIAKRLKSSDNQAKGVQREYDALPESRFLPAFFARYGNAFCMESGRESASPLIAPSEALSSQEQEQEQEQEQREGASPKPPTPPSASKPRKASKPAKTGIPVAFAVSDAVAAWAATKGFARLDVHLESFKAKVAANGYAYFDWDAAFMEAIRQDWAGVRSGRGAPPAANAAPWDGAR